MMISRGVNRIITLPKYALIGLVLLYQYCLSPFLGQRCRFYPSCSQYAVTALRKHGMIRAFFLIGKRLLCCHPWHPGGNDPVP